MCFTSFENWETKHKNGTFSGLGKTNIYGNLIGEGCVERVSKSVVLNGRWDIIRKKVWSELAKGSITVEGEGTSLKITGEFKYDSSISMMVAEGEIKIEGDRSLSKHIEKLSRFFFFGLR